MNVFEFLGKRHKNRYGFDPNKSFDRRLESSRRSIKQRMLLNSQRQLQKSCVDFTKWIENFAEKLFNVNHKQKKTLFSTMESGGGDGGVSVQLFLMLAAAALESPEKFPMLHLN